MLKTLLELQRLKRLERTGWQLRGLPNGTESVAAHSFGVSITAMFLADEIVTCGMQLDIEKLLRMALLHDSAETRMGDLPKTASEYFGAELRRQAETAAFADVVQGLGPREAFYRDLHKDYETRESLEARVVKAADVIDLLVQVLALERAGARGLDEFWTVIAEADFKLPAPAAEVINGVFQALLDERRKSSTP